MDTRAVTPRVPQEDSQSFKRVYFFKHFLTEEDWNARHDYHVQKRRLHMQYLHGEGIQDGMRQMRVRQTSTPSLKVEITPGIATDDLGNELCVQSLEAATIELDKLQLPTTVYIKITYQEMASDRVRLADGRVENKYFRETYRFVVSEKPAMNSQLELARVALSADCVSVRNPADPLSPGLNEIDMRYRRNQPCNRNIDMDTRIRLLKLLYERKRSFDRVGGHARLGAVASIGQSFLVLAELIEANVIKEQSVGDILDFFRQMDEHMVSAVMANVDERVLERPEWQKHLGNCYAFRQLVLDPTKTPMQKLSMALVQMEKLSFSYAHLERLIGNERRIYLPNQVKPLPRVYPITSNWDFVKVWSAEMPEVFEIDELEWLRMGELNVTNEASERRYKFRISESRDAWKNRQRLHFPDGSLIEDTGVAHEGGFSEIVISHVIPDTHFAIIRMMDYARGDYELMINVNGVDVGISRCEGFDRRWRWRNWPFVIPSYFVNDTVLRIRQTPLMADRDVNMFRFWFYQPINW
ncbi:MAG: hypothetical protein FWC40_05330 [Proteobacteria bacterium]|nr:hypothetical protein [Pseudomonadota bacterium]